VARAAPVVVGTVLSATQLNATASAPGSFVYTPAAGTVLNTAGPQALSTAFTPTDTGNYNGATASVSNAIPGITISWSWRHPLPRCPLPCPT